MLRPPVRGDGAGNNGGRDKAARGIMNRRRGEREVDFRTVLAESGGFLLGDRAARCEPFEGRRKSVAQAGGSEHRDGCSDGFPRRISKQRFRAAAPTCDRAVRRTGEGGVVVLLRGNIAHDGDVAADGSTGIAHGSDGDIRGVLAAVLAPRDEFMAPGIDCLERRLHLSKECGVLPLRREDEWMLSDQIRGGVAGDAGTGAIDILDGSFGVGDQDAFSDPVEGGRQKDVASFGDAALRFHSNLLTCGTVPVSPDNTPNADGAWIQTADRCR